MYHVNSYVLLEVLFYKYYVVYEQLNQLHLFPIFLLPNLFIPFAYDELQWA